MRIERNIERLPAAMQSEIHHAESVLNDSTDSDMEPQLAHFRLEGEDHMAYYVPQEVDEGTVEFVFECLIY